MELVWPRDILRQPLGRVPQGLVRQDADAQGCTMTGSDKEVRLTSLASCAG